MEIWKNIEEHPAYMISNMGRIKSLNYRLTGTERIMTLSPNKKGYLQVRLNGKMYRVSRLVAQAFIPNPDNKPYIDHINTDKTDNRVENLRWCTATENINNPLTRHHISQSKKGVRFKNKLKPVIQFTNDDIFVKRWDCATDVQTVLGINKGNISKLCKGKISCLVGGYKWKYLSDIQLLGDLAIVGRLTA